VDVEYPAELTNVGSQLERRNKLRRLRKYTPHKSTVTIPRPSEKR
jgi:hypothetical protein